MIYKNKNITFLVIFKEKFDVKQEILTLTLIYCFYSNDR